MSRLGWMMIRSHHPTLNKPNCRGVEMSIRHDTEVWLDVKGYEGKYQVSNLGRVKSFARNKIGKIMNPSTIKGGYKTLPLRKNGKQKYYSIHRLVLTVFIGPCPKGMEGCHKDGNPSNNRLENLRWDTPKNNCKDRGNYGVAKLAESEVIEARKMYEDGNKEWGLATKLARRFNIDVSTMCSILRRDTWKHI